jgi:hypothetical protein
MRWELQEMTCVFLSMIRLFFYRHQLAVLAALLTLPRDKLSLPLGKDDKNAF